MAVDISCPHEGLFKGLRTDAAEMTVTPCPVVEHFNVIEDRAEEQEVLTTQTDRPQVSVK